jgi:hypothetical protein
MSPLKKIRIRMYRHGLGDCFLLTLTSDDNEKFNILIDCGVLLGTPNAPSIMTEVAKDIKSEVGQKLDVVVITHEHWDHLSGFVQAKSIFDTIEFKEVWVAWTEDKTNTLAKKLRKVREQRKQALQLTLTKLRSEAMQNEFLTEDQRTARLGYLDAVQEVTSFSGDLGAAPGSSTSDALDYVINKAKQLYYCTPGTDPFSLKGISGLQFYVLGPPEDEKLIKKGLSVKEVYHKLFLSDMGNNFISALPLAEVNETRDKYLPFDKYKGIRIAEAKPHLTGYNNKDQWRKIDNDWMDFSGQLALALDSDTNNTSLVLALELTASNEFLLFPGDAQVGNWLSWYNYTWNAKDKDGNKEELDIKKIFERTIFYKVGHHGSHNATLSDKGLELMTNKSLAVMIPVSQEMAKKKKWNMPFPPLLNKLKERSHGRVIVADEDFNCEDGKSQYMSAAEWDTFKGSVDSQDSKLFIDYIIECQTPT